MISSKNETSVLLLLRLFLNLVAGGYEGFKLCKNLDLREYKKY